ncbi:MAG: hypothetical protein OES99_00810 [Gammaproteobacteria bacterium]|nr:hypothetical protein [Gammaproteobacteria bacterium]
MTFLLTQIFLCLLAAVLIGAVAGWFFRHDIARRREVVIRDNYKSQLRHIEIERDRSVQNLSGKIEKLKQSAAQSVETDNGTVSSDYERLIEKQEERVVEREQAISELRSEIQSLRSGISQANAAAAARENGLRLEHEREIAKLKSEDTQPGDRNLTEQTSRVHQLEVDIQSRDDSIAVLRDDLAELNQQTGGGRGLQDQELRAAMNESLSWQEKYENTVADLAEMESQLNEYEQRSGKDLKPDTADRTSRKKGDDRIASLAADANQSKDSLQEIKGIGPVLEHELNQYGIYRFQQIAEFDASDVARLAARIGRFSSRIDTDNWVEQATVLYKKYYG